ncbi:hypothetical protein ACP70R_007793 [Stipagrostis hirtigluma subsp. patula]
MGAGEDSFRCSAQRIHLSAADHGSRPGHGSLLCSPPVRAAVPMRIDLRSLDLALAGAGFHPAGLAPAVQHTPPSTIRAPTYGLWQRGVGVRLAGWFL